MLWELVTDRDGVLQSCGVAETAHGLSARTQAGPPLGPGAGPLLAGRGPFKGGARALLCGARALKGGARAL